MNMCQEPNFLKLLILSEEVINIIKIAAAVVLIITGMITLAKVVIEDKADLAKALNNLKNKVIVACLVILLPTIFNWIFFTQNIITENMGDYSECVANMNWEKIKELEEAKENALKELENNKNQSNNNNNNNNNNNTESNNIQAINWDYTSETNVSAIRFINNFEGVGKSCDDSNYKAENLRDRAITAGHGITNSMKTIASNLGYGQYFPMSEGDCIPKVVIDNIQKVNIQSIIAKVENECNKKTIKCSKNEIIAITSLAYNLGSGKITGAVQKLAIDKQNPNLKNKNTIEYFSKFVNYTNNEGVKVKSSALIKRRDIELQLLIDNVDKSNNKNSITKYVSN